VSGSVDTGTLKWGDRPQSGLPRKSLEEYRGSPRCFLLSIVTPPYIVDIMINMHSTPLAKLTKSM